MIDFKLNEIGDIVIKENDKSYPKFRLDFNSSDITPKLRIDFITKDRPIKNNGLKISFRIEEPDNQKQGLYIPCVRKKEEKAQSIAIRLKTELDEIKRFFNNFGSELIKLRHQDLLNEGNHELIKQYVSNAISDIIYENGYIVEVKREKLAEGNFAIENLTVYIKELNGKTIYSYTI